MAWFEGVWKSNRHARQLHLREQITDRDILRACWCIGPIQNMSAKPVKFVLKTGC